MFSGKKYKLPKYPPNTRAAFKRLCRAVSSEEMLELKEILSERMSELRKEAQSNPKLNLKLAEDINASCQVLLNVYEDRNSAEQALIVGAICYFIAEKDSLSDEAFASGFHDDAQIVNHVLEELGIEDHFISF